jgi:hypothetical protein
MSKTLKQTAVMEKLNHMVQYVFFEGRKCHASVAILRVVALMVLC